MFDYLQIMNEEIVAAAIKEEASNDEDIENIWLI